MSSKWIQRWMWLLWWMAIAAGVEAVAQPILIPGRNAKDKFLSAFWNQNNNASNAIAGINAYGGTNRFATNRVEWAGVRSMLGVSSNVFTMDASAGERRVAIGLDQGAPGALGTNLLTAESAAQALGVLGLSTNDYESPFNVSSNVFTTNASAGERRAAIGLDQGAPGATGTNLLTAESAAQALGVLGLSTNGYESPFNVSSNVFTTNASAGERRAAIGLDQGAPGAVGTNLLTAESVSQALGVLGLSTNGYESPFNVSSNVFTTDASAGERRAAIGLDQGAPGATGTNLLTAESAAQALGVLGLSTNGYESPFNVSSNVFTTDASAGERRAVIGLDQGAPGALGTNLLTAVSASQVTGLLGISTNPPKVTWYTNAGTFYHTNQSWTRNFTVTLCAGGGGGGSGRVGADSTAAFGGGAGGGGGFNTMTFACDQLAGYDYAIPFTVTVGEGGSGGPSQSGDSLNGAAGADGGGSWFGSLIAVIEGDSGGSGSAASGGGGSFNAPGASSSISGTPGTPLAGGYIYNWNSASGGGGGGGINTSNVPRAGGLGGNSAYTYPKMIGGDGGNATGANGSPGDSRDVWSTGPWPAGGGGGGGANISGNGGDGGDGGWPGGGGGGGGAARDGGDSGKGGNGGGGFVLVIERP